MRPKRPFMMLAVLICVVFVVHGQQQQPYLLGPGDVVEVRVFGQHDLSANAQIDSDEARLSEIRIYRQKGIEPQQLIRVDLEAVKKNKQPDVILQPYDVIEVSDNGLFGGGSWLEKLAAILLRNTPVLPLR